MIMLRPQIRRKPQNSRLLRPSVDLRSVLCLGCLGSLILMFEIRSACNDFRQERFRKPVQIRLAEAGR